MSEMAQEIYRTHTCGELTERNLNETIRLAGWVDTIRDHGGVAFLDLRDQYGVTQVVVHDDALLKDLHRETAITVSGKVVARDEETVNPKIPTGRLEVLADALEVLGPCVPNLPFDVQDSTDTREEDVYKRQTVGLSQACRMPTAAAASSGITAALRSTGWTA